MAYPFLALSDRLRRTATLDSYWTLINAELARYGVTSMFYAALATRQEVEARGLTRSLFWKSNHPEAFFEAFGGRDKFLDDDVTARHCYNNESILFWDVARAIPKAAPRERARLELELKIGFDVGVSLPASLFSPGQLGGIGLSMSAIKRPAFRAHWTAHSAEILMLCGMLDVGMREQYLVELVGLSPRETECLSWLAAGLRPEQIADRLKIGEKSVEKYILGAKTKLKATTRDQAVAKALLLGLIRP